MLPHLTSPPPATTSCQVIKRFIMHSKKTAFVVEHDFIMATYLADRVIVYEGQASKHATARTPQSLQSGRQGRGLYVQRGFSYRFSSKVEQCLYLRQHYVLWSAQGICYEPLWPLPNIALVDS
jgi:hypothetical protein